MRATRNGPTSYLKCLASGAVLSALGCGTGIPENDYAANITLNGAVEKGPFVVGSSVWIAGLDQAGAQTGDLRLATTEDDLGRFSVAIDGAPAVSVEASGYYFNELTASLSGAPLTLRAVLAMDERAEQPAYVNVLTHLCRDRALRLMGDGVAPAAAMSQAEAELAAALPLPLEFAGHGSELSLVGENGSAYLLVASAVLVNAAVLRSSGGIAISGAAGTEGSIDASLQELLNKLALDLADDGALSAANTELLNISWATLDLQRVRGALQQRLADLGLDLEVPDPTLYFDWDGDGPLGIDDNCPYTYNPGQEDGDGDGIGDACVCGNGLVDAGEMCDDGNTDPNDGCLSDCTYVWGGAVCTTAGAGNDGAPTCPPNFYCDATTGACVPLPMICNADAECAAGLGCLDGMCQAAVCWMDDDCPPETACTYDACRPFCDGASDCQPGEYCRSGVCFAEEQVVACASYLDCGSGQVCVDGLCSQLCGSGADCPIGLACQQGACLPDAGATACVDGAICAGGQACVNGVCQSVCNVDNDCPLDPATGMPLVCLSGLCTASSSCGNGMVELFEQCDDGNLAVGDGCDAACWFEPGFSCVGEPSSCAATCGDGLLAVSVEECDDGNRDNGDGCSSTCALE